MKKSLGIALVLSLILLISSPALASDETYSGVVIEDIIIESSDADIMPLRYDIISSIGAGIDLKNNEISCSGHVETWSTVYQIKITVQLQKYVNGEWTRYASWSSIAHHTDTLTLAPEDPYPVDSGSYRVYVTGTPTPYAGNPETQTSISKTVP